MDNLYIVVSHLDDWELATYGFIAKRYKEYKQVNIIICTTWPDKVAANDLNIQELQEYLKIKINYVNLNYPQREVYTSFDRIKDDLYSTIDWKSKFCILTHDIEDNHTDHVGIATISKGMYKFAEQYITIFSPSTCRFNPNYYVELDQETATRKFSAIQAYDFSNEQSYSQSGYYFHQDMTERINISRSHVLENYSNVSRNLYEIFKIHKWR